MNANTTSSSVGEGGGAGESGASQIGAPERAFGEADADENGSSAGERDLMVVVPRIETPGRQMAP